MTETKKFSGSLITEALDTIKGLQKDLFGDREYQNEGRNQLEYEFLKAEKEGQSHSLMIHAPEDENLFILSAALKSALEKFRAPELYLKSMNFSSGVDIRESVHLSESKSTISIDEPALGILLNIMKLPKGEEKLLKTEARSLDIKYPDLLTGYDSNDFVSAYNNFGTLFKLAIKEVDEQKYHLATGKDIHKETSNHAALKGMDVNNKYDRTYGFDKVVLLGVDLNLIHPAKTMPESIFVETDLSKNIITIHIKDNDLAKNCIEGLNVLIKNKHLTTELKDIENLKFNHQTDEHGHATIDLDENLSKFLTKYSLPNTEDLAKKHGMEQVDIKSTTQRDTGEGNGNISREESLAALKQLRAQGVNKAESNWVSKTNNNGQPKNKNFLDKILSYFANPISLDEILKDNTNGATIAKEILEKGSGIDEKQSKGEFRTRPNKEQASSEITYHIQSKRTGMNIDISGGGKSF